MIENSWTKLILLATAVAASCVLTGCGEETSSPEGACEAAALTASSSRLSPGDTVTISGARFFEDCYDSIAVAPDGSQSPAPGATPAARDDITVELVVGDGAVPLARVDAGPDGTFEIETVVPEDAPRGEAELRAVVLLEDGSQAIVGSSAEMESLEVG